MPISRCHVQSGRNCLVYISRARQEEKKGPEENFNKLTLFRWDAGGQMNEEKPEKEREQKSQWLLKPHTWTEMWLGIVAF